ncbi:MAG TPA: NfeD family protein [Nitrospiria bacterium]|jgi:membrane protein implicated in regulation of membrane protease activity|nr:NfeD family protein [Nitrospiria bacterium]
MSAYLTPAIIWLSLGVLLLIIEVATSGFWMGFFGAGALITSLAVWIGVTEGIDTQIAIFLVTSILLLLALRGPLTRWLNRGAPSTTFGDTGQAAVVVQEIPAGGMGRVSYQGSTWDAESDRGQAIPRDTRVRIVRQKGIRLYVRADHASS